MREACCGSTMPAIVIYNLFTIYLQFILFLVSAAAACVRHPAGHAIIELLINLLINLQFNLLIYYLVPVAAACVKHPAAA
jgi:ABC-type methionine transport system permease subunit